MSVSANVLLAKADMAVADLTGGSGYLTPEQSNRFIDIMIKRSTLLQRVRTERMNAPQRLLESLYFGNRILRPGTEGQALAVNDRTKPDQTKVEVNTVEYVAEIRLNDHVLEDNIEHGALKNTIMQRATKAVARDVEELAWNGDTALVATDAYLGSQDGFRKKITSNIYDHLGATTNEDLWTGMLKTMPNEFLVRGDLMFMTSVKSELEWRSVVGSRATALGDRVLTEDNLPQFGGIPILAIPVALENLGGGNETEAVVTNPKNLVVGIQRQIRFETGRDVSARQTIIVITVRVGFAVEHELAAVKSDNLVVG